MNGYTGGLVTTKSHSANSRSICMNIYISIRIDTNGITDPISTILSTDADLRCINIYIADICHSDIAADRLNGVIICTKWDIRRPDIDGIHILYSNGSSIPYVQTDNSICCIKSSRRIDVQSSQIGNSQFLVSTIRIDNSMFRCVRGSCVIRSIRYRYGGTRRITGNGNSSIKIYISTIGSIFRIFCNSCAAGSREIGRRYHPPP